MFGLGIVATVASVAVATGFDVCGHRDGRG
jgi:hypothetical protein